MTKVEILSLLVFCALALSRRPRRRPEAHPEIPPPLFHPLAGPGPDRPRPPADPLPRRRPVCRYTVLAGPCVTRRRR